MPRKPRIHYTETDKALMWDRWRKGESGLRVIMLLDNRGFRKKAFVRPHTSRSFDPGTASNPAASRIRWCARRGDTSENLRRQLQAPAADTIR